MVRALLAPEQGTYASDGFDYSPEYLEHYSWHQPEMRHLFAAKILGEAREWAALGFFAWLYEIFPRICLEDRRDGGSQASPFFPGNLPGEDFRANLREIDMSENEASRLLKILERHGILWIVNKGNHIVYLELRPPAKEE